MPEATTDRPGAPSDAPGALSRAADSIAGAAGDAVAGYGGGEEMPLGGYSALLGAYGVLAGAALGMAGGRFPERVSAGDVALLGVATHKLARIVTRDWVTAPVRAPFTRYVESLGSGEVREEARGEGVRRAVGDLLTCPWCIGPWIAGALATGMAVAPRATRMAATAFAAVAVSDFLHHAYERARPGDG